MMTENDRAAMELAIQRARAGNKGTRKQIDAMIADGHYRRAVHQAVYGCQMETLHLPPWESPPCWVNDPDRPEKGDEAAAQLLREMLALGVSRWHPDPMAAIEEAKQKKASATP